jgi:hypothetical protein
MWSIVAVLMLLGGTVLGAAHEAGPAAAQEKGRAGGVQSDLALVKTRATQPDQGRTRYVLAM